MADTPEGTGITVDEAASLLTGAADTREESETPAPQADQPGATGNEHEADNEVPTAEAAEGAEDNAEGVTEESGDEERSEGPAQELDPSTKLRVKNPDGTEGEVTLGELTKGYLRQSDYTRKTMALANQHKDLEQAFGVIQAQRAEEIKVVQFAQQVLASSMSQEPDWARLAQEDPIGFIQTKAAWDQQQGQLQALQAHQQQIALQHHAVQTAEQHQRVDRERETLITQLPEWKNPETAKAERNKLREYGQKAGFTEPELMGLYDHRQVLILRKAMLYDELLAKRPGIQAKAPQAPMVMQPGAGQGGGGSRTIQKARAMQRLAQSGSVEDAAAALLS